jgi:hypothetical protein
MEIYEKTTWATGDKITDSKLNKIEDELELLSAAIDELQFAVQELQEQLEPKSAEK